MILSYLIWTAGVALNVGIIATRLAPDNLIALLNVAAIIFLCLVAGYFTAKYRTRNEHHAQIERLYRELARLEARVGIER